MHRQAGLIILGATLGGLAAFGRLPGVAHIFQALADVAATLALNAANWATGQLAVDAATGQVGAAAIALITPGMICLLLAAGARLGLAAKAAAEAALAIVAASGWLVLDNSWQAALLTLLCVGIGGLLVKVTGAAVAVPLAAAAAATAVSGLQTVLQTVASTGNYGHQQAVRVFAEYLHDPVLYMPVVVGLSAAGYVIALSWLLSSATPAATPPPTAGWSP